MEATFHSRHRLLSSIGFIVLPIVLLFISLCLGRYFISPTTVYQILLSKVMPIEQTWSAMEETVVLTVRLPRTILAMMIGAGLSISGASFQGMFGNPLVSPHILGVSSGAGFGAALSIVLFGSSTITIIFAIAFGIVAMLVTFSISKVRKKSPLFVLILAGVITSAMFEAALSLIQYVADPQDELPTIVFWLMGSLAGTSYASLIIGVPLILIGIIILWLLRWRINIMSLSETEAKSLGTNVHKMRWGIIVASTLITATAVSLSGIIGWVGLIIPHIARMIVGSNHQILIPVSISIGAMYLLVIDNVARTLTAAEIPLSILTAIFGVPFFAYLLRKTKGGWT
ncbi:FecCD family ABC transporter permease [Bacillus sp. Hm123]|uniref:FecCD family ABC transporter permease n=1 Tax=Bacillus sp. Hm123 TaxID=3450745 RepID=UPI003F4243E1